MTTRRAVAFLGLCIAAIGGARAQEVFVEGTVQGTVRVGAESLKNATVRASSGALTSRKTFPADGDGAPTLAYRLPVNVPEGEVLPYLVQAVPVSLVDGGRIDFPRRTVDVAGGAEVTVDFVIDQPGFVAGQVRVLGADGAFDPELLSSALLGFNGGGFVYIARTDRAQDGAYRIAVNPGTVNLIPSAGGGCCRVRLRDGTQIRIAPTDDQKNLTVAAGQTLTLDLEIQAPATGTIAGTVAMPGPLTPSGRHGIAVVGNGINSGFSADDQGEFSRGSLLPGTYFLRATSRFNEGTDDFQHPGSSFSVGGVALEEPIVEVVAGQTTTVAVSSRQAFLNGTFELTGSVPTTNVWRGRIEATRTGPTGSEGLAGDAAVTDGAFDLVVNPGDWELTRYVFSVSQDDPERPIDASMTLFPSVGHRPSATLDAAGQTVQLEAIELPTGTLTIRFESLDGTPFSSPRVHGGCLQRSPSGDSTLRAQLNARDDTIDGVTQAKVVMVGIAGECQLLTAQAWVEGSLVTFGTFSEEFVEGVDRGKDIGSTLELTVESPEPGVVTSPAVAVRGRVTDDVGVASVTVNGVEVELVSTGNPEDDKEVKFEHPLDLRPGPNPIVTVARNGEGREASDSRTVTYEGPAADTEPPTVTVADRTVEATGPSTPVDVSGDATATDDVGVASLTNDSPGTFPAGQTTPVTWTAYDAAGNSASAVQNVTLVDTTPPALAKTQMETVLWPPNHKMVKVLTVTGVSDLVDPEPVVEINVSSNEPVDGLGDGDRAPDWEVIRDGDAWDVWVRAERSGSGDGRTYTIEVRATDASQNASAQTCKVKVPHDRGER